MERPATVDADSWQNVARFGSDQEVLAFLEHRPLHHLPLNRIAWRVKRSRDFFQSTTAVLTARGVFDRTLFSYGFHHRDTEAVGDFLLHERDFLNHCGGYLKSQVVTVDPVSARNV